MSWKLHDFGYQSFWIWYGAGNIVFAVTLITFNKDSAENSLALILFTFADCLLQPILNVLGR